MMVTQKDTYIVAKNNGFEEYAGNSLYVPTKLALIMSECSEALEAHRKGEDEDLPYELADIILRTMQLAEALGIDLQKAVEEKHAINVNRPYKHGNKRY